MPLLKVSSIKARVIYIFVWNLPVVFCCIKHFVRFLIIDIKGESLVVVEKSYDIEMKKQCVKVLITELKGKSQ